MINIKKIIKTKLEIFWNAKSSQTLFLAVMILDKLEGCFKRETLKILHSIE